MRIETLSVRNLRLYGDEVQTIEFDRTKKVTVLLGDNGAGKTALLYGCSVLLSQFYKHFPSCSARNFSDEDVRIVSNSKRADYLYMGAKLVPSIPEVTEYMPLDSIENREQIVVNLYKKGNNTKTTPSSELKTISEYSLKMKSKIDNSEEVSLPIIAYYGTERGQIKPVERRRNFNEVFPRWDIYKADSLESATDFKRFFTWFERNEDLERREQLRQLKQTGTSSYSSFVLDAVRTALNKLFPDYLKNPRVETSPLRFVMDDISNLENPIEQRLERMSDGYRITIALVADIAARLAEANPSREASGLENPLDANGIVMIDEIDLHLHPKLQREILHRLTEIFPNVQFIVSTHSPNVVIGALNLVQVIKLNHGIIESDINVSNYDKYDVSLLLLSDLFELDNVRTTKFKELEDREEALLNKSNLTPDELLELKSIVREMRTYGYADGKEEEE
ncbi:MAG: AAA family ATPase [Bacteroides sp.]|nr:AAA family ATPase [Bacteroides sp.]